MYKHFLSKIFYEMSSIFVDRKYYLVFLVSYRNLPNVVDVKYDLYLIGTVMVKPMSNPPKRALLNGKFAYVLMQIFGS